MPTFTTRQEQDQTFIVLGEAPGRMEDRKGIPFIGPAGQLLRNILTEMGIEHQAVYMNTVSCWPVGEENLKPTEGQMSACRGNLKDQLDAIPSPWVLSCGRVATTALIRHSTTTTNGHLVPIHDKLVFPILHPSFILRKREQETYLQWHATISKFFMMMAFGNMNDPLPSCIYCTNPKYGKLVTCYKHRREFQKDQVWDLPRRGRGKGKIAEGQEDLFG